MSEPEHATTITSRRRPRKTLRAGTATAVVTAVVAGAAYAAGLGPFARGTASGSGPAPAAVAQARAFLADWAAGRLPNAAGRTNRPGTAQEVLSNFTKGLDIGRPALTAEAPAEGGDGNVSVPFTARMPIAGLGTWTYKSKLSLSEQEKGGWKVNWTLSLVHPHLSDTAKFHLERGGADPAPVVDRNGKTLSIDAHPSVRPVLAQVASGGGGSGSGPRGAIQLVDRATGEVERTEATFGGQGDTSAGRTVHTTLDVTWQSAAEKALAAHADGKNASLVALRIDNGQILAMANSPSSGFNRAVSGTYAPGSTWKIVTSSALLLKDAVAPGDIVDCPKYLTVGKQFHNVETSEHRNATFLRDFAESCNTAFIGLRGKLGDQELGDVARKYFGVGQDWHVGIPSYDGSVPAPKDETEKAASVIGQGRIQANPLIMASVTATAVSGTFHQPTIKGDAKDTTTTAALPGKVVTRLREMMRTTVTDGTARSLSDLSGDIGAKTGTAEVSDGEPNNGWLVAYRGNVAVACVVEQGITGGGSAGPILHSLLAAVPADAS
ncbi:penicillin-binding protein [Streptomyces fodineus]|uniref:Penicillin-binding protein n=1 Tax=Streptomyces fodineus TaxID=1904616 RepID=A0A1D7Y559_9ACTN|nr:penicillin-binding transpeptidase domain-containing protein [Streptomyces fodineus]AOR30570.1 penicillin-binding protein [Streptomyces fodineus]